jgi:hypothetical protein
VPDHLAELEILEKIASAGFGAHKSTPDRIR